MPDTIEAVFVTRDGLLSRPVAVPMLNRFTVHTHLMRVPQSEPIDRRNIQTVPLFKNEKPHPAARVYEFRTMRQDTAVYHEIEPRL